MSPLFAFTGTFSSSALIRAFRHNKLCVCILYVFSLYLNIAAKHYARLSYLHKVENAVGSNWAISWYSFCVGQDIYRLFSIIEIILGNYQQV